MRACSGPVYGLVRGIRAVLYNRTMEYGELLTYEQVAKRLGLKAVTIRMWTSGGRIASIKIGRAVRIPEGEVRRILDEGIDRRGAW